MNKNPIDELTQEHGPIKVMLRVLEKMNEKISRGEDVSNTDLNNGIIFLKEFADKCHHGKEENLLFPMMKKNNIKKELELIDVLIAEHVVGRSCIKNMMTAIEMKSSDKAGFVDLFVKNSEAYIKLLDQHIDKENLILFPEAKQSLPEEKLKELEVGFENVEKNIIGEGRHAELHKLIDELKRRYLSQRQGFKMKEPRFLILGLVSFAVGVLAMYIIEKYF